MGCGQFHKFGAMRNSWQRFFSKNADEKILREWLGNRAAIEVLPGKPCAAKILIDSAAVFPQSVHRKGRKAAVSRQLSAISS
jgi:hypothetical protein